MTPSPSDLGKSHQGEQLPRYKNSTNFTHKILLFTLEKECQNLQVIGDSMLVIKSLKESQRCTHISLSSLLEEIQEIKSKFNSFPCMHVYREMNQEANTLSKKGLVLDKGKFKIEQSGYQVFQYYHRPFIEANHDTNEGTI